MRIDLSGYLLVPWHLKEANGRTLVKHTEHEVHKTPRRTTTIQR